MELVEALKTENQSLRDVLSQLNAEKNALDQLAMQNIKDNVNLRSQLFLLQEKFKNHDDLVTFLNKQISDLKSDKKPTLEVCHDDAEAVVA